jgi:hypothetical protein
MPPLALKYMCRVTDCCLQFPSVKALIGHMNLQHSDNKRLNLDCMIDDCSYMYNSVETFRKHLRLSHASHWENAESLNSMQHDSVNNNHSVLDVADNNSEDDQMSQTRICWDTFLNDFAKHVAFLKLKTTEMYMLPKSVAHSIFQDMKTVFDIFQQHFVGMVKDHLANIGINYANDLLLQQIFGEESIFDIVQNKFASDHLLDKYLTENLKMNSPVACHANATDKVLNSVTKKTEINMEDSRLVVGSGNMETNNLIGSTAETDRDRPTVLDNNDYSATVDSRPDFGSVLTDSISSNNKVHQYHYVPILVTLRNYLEQPDVWASCHQPGTTDGMLRNYTDGDIYGHSSQRGDKDFVRIHLYSDEVEICNPIGSRKTVHKLSAFYFLVGNIETKYWSSLTNIHLALLCKYSIVKAVGYAKVLEPLLADIKKLETEGIDIKVDGMLCRVFGSIVTFSGDNLTSHAIAGFNENFSYGRVCRYCMATNSSLAELHCETKCQLRTPEGHSYHLKAIQLDKALTSVYGVKRVSCFSVVSGFSPVTFFPPDVMHDVLEGLMTVNIGVVLKSMIRRKVITVKAFNIRLANFKFGAADSVDKFSPLPLDFVSKNKSVSGKAVEKWCMFRLLSLIVGDIVPEGDKFWKLHLLCREICEIVLAPVVDPAWLPHLELIILHHHKLFAEIAPSSFTPKVHFITHYPRLILAYGPLRHLWVMRFEAAHQYFKQLSRRVKNFKNISATLSQRYQAKKCYEHAANSLLLSGTVTPCSQKSVRLSQLPVKLVQLLKERNGTPTSDVMYSVKALVVNGQTFRVGSAVVYDVVNAEEIPQFVSIRYIFSVGSTWLVCGILSSASCINTHLHAHIMDAAGDWFLFHPSQNIDCQCLSVYNYCGENVVILKHRVCRKRIGADLGGVTGL